MNDKIDLTTFVNTELLKQGISEMIPEGNLFEVRMLKKGAYSKTYTGYFDSVDSLIKNLPKIDYSNCNAYFTLNQINEACRGKSNFGKFSEGNSATSDNDIINRNWLYIDIDPTRPTDTSSTNKQFEESQQIAVAVDTYMQEELKFYPAVKAISGNGTHLLYRIDVPSNKETDELITNCLNALDHLFSTDTQKIDISVKNASRICKLYGTLAQKGRNISEQPHRMSKIITEHQQFKDIKINEREKLEALAKIYELQKQFQQKFQRSNFTGNSKFDLDKFITEHGIKIKYKKQLPYAVAYILEECVFNSSHNNGEACILVFPNGAMQYKCLHDSCGKHHWQDVRKQFDPEYDPEGYEHRHDNYQPKREKQQHIVQEQNSQEQPREFISTKHFVINEMKNAVSKFQDTHGRRTGFMTWDMIQGELYSGVYVLFAISSLGKTTLAHQIADNMATNGQHVLFFSLEMSTHEMICKSINREARKLNSDTNTTALKIRRGYQSEEIETATQNYISSVEERISIVEGNFNYTAEDISKDIEAYIAKTGRKPVVFIDYLQLLKPVANVRQTTKETMDSAITELKQISRKHNITIVTISSINRNNYQSEVSFEALKESGSIEYTADVIWGLQLQAVTTIPEKSSKSHANQIIREAKLDTPRKIELVCLKNRYGQSSYTLNFHYYPRNDYFEEIDVPVSKKKYCNVKDLKKGN